MKKSIIFFLAISLFFSCKDSNSNTAKTTNQKETKQLRKVPKAKDGITLDGVADESIWQSSTWYPINELWLGKPYTAEDFEAEYAMCWTEKALYVLVKVKDDVLYNPYEDPLTRWWDDDCVEVFIDEDNSGGDHQYNHNAFAYHVDLNGDVVDVIAENTPKLFNDHVITKRISEGNTSVWELKISIFDDSYQNDKENEPVMLKAGKKIGFAIAYCDNDQSEERENFIGSIAVEGDDKNRGWIDASIFGTIELTN
ncbi:sugar-binding protein [Winogradskyella sp. 3972H.M.0a.05]|uniref:sugar-binding protein n=1 Tax=Winogradskyella sp. 3972H.M.0a.05 TaxID=2950277 RepID=UPI00339168C7